MITLIRARNPLHAILMAALKHLGRGAKGASTKLSPTALAIKGQRLKINKRSKVLKIKSENKFGRTL